MTPTDKTLKKFILEYFGVINLILLLHVFTNFFIELYDIAYAFIICIIFHFFLFITVYKLRFAYIKPFIFIYLLITAISLYILTSSYWRNSSIVFIWLLAIPIAAKYVYNSKKIVLYWSLAIIIIGVMAILTPKKYVLAHIPEIKDIIQIKFWSIFINIITFIIIFVFLLYYEYKVEKIRDTHIELAQINNIRNISSEYYIELYSKIEEYVKTYQPWKDPNFKLTDLAKAVNSNNTYVSHAINYCAKMNFNFFVNKYRIEYAKELLENKNNYDRISDIYRKVGFKQQTTFNKVFKNFVKLTPSEYSNAKY